jgi:PEP-CTERM motif
MKTIIRNAALIIALLTSAAAQATTFNFSYTFTDGPAVTGSFDGTLVGDVINDPTNIFVFAGGQAFAGNGSLQAMSLNGDASAWVSGATVSFDLNKNNFLFLDGSPYAGFTNALLLTKTTVHVAEIHTQRNGSFIQLANSSWQLSVASAVPEPETCAMMLAGLGLVGALARRRQKRA